jgi:uncharacterized protein YdeI (YjbR/CyaY-like superfamily)
MKPTFFAAAADFRAWLEEHHASVRELLLGFYKTGSGRGGITYQQALDEALCFGWIDGVRKRRDESSYTIRFSPRQRRSIWSAVNVRRVGELAAAGRMHPAGTKAFDSRDPARTQIYSYERAAARFDPASERRFRANRVAWRFFESQAPSYRRAITGWIMSAKKEETRCRRLDQLIAHSERQLRVGLLSPSRSLSDSARSRSKRR